MNRLSDDHLRKWRALYSMSLISFKRGAMSEDDLLGNLMHLNYKYQALDVEILEFKRERSRWRSQNGINPNPVNER